MTTHNARAQAVGGQGWGWGLFNPVFPEWMRLTRVKSLLLLTLFMLVQLASFVLVLPARANPWLFGSSIALVALAVFLLVRPKTSLVPIRPAQVAALMSAASYAFTLPHDPDTTLAGYAAPHLGAYTAVLLMLVRRGRAPQAWLALSGIAVICVGYSMATGDGLTPRLQSLMFNVVLVLLFTIFIKALERMARGVANAQRRNAAATSDAAVAELAAAEQNAHIDRLLETAGPMLERIADGAGLSEAERTECLVIEAQLRDATRAPNLSTGPLTVAVRAARTRGVPVVLFDDRPDSPLQDPLAKLLANWLVAGLESVATGTVTIRLLPVGRNPIATMTVSDSMMTSSTQEFTTYGPAVASAARTPATPVPLP
jgi:hypothetical protein